MWEERKKLEKRVKRLGDSVYAYKQELLEEAEEQYKINDDLYKRRIRLMEDKFEKRMTKLEFKVLNPPKYKLGQLIKGKGTMTEVECCHGLTTWKGAYEWHWKYTYINAKGEFIYITDKTEGE